MKTAFLPILFVFLCHSSFAQLRLGPFAGYSFTNCTVSEDSRRTIETSGAAGFVIGGIVELPLASCVSIQSGMLYMTEGCILEHYVTQDDKRISMHNVAVPLNIQYEFPSFRRQKVIAGVEFYCSANVYNQVDYYYPPDRWRDSKKPSIKPISLGYGIYFGYEMPNGLYLRATLQRSITNVFDMGYFTEGTAKCVPEQANIGIGYLMRTRRTAKSNKNDPDVPQHK